MEYITQDEKEQLEAKLSQCLAKRKVITQRIEEARALGDLKENAEYHAAREDQGMNENRIREYEDRLSRAVVADDAELPEGMVFLGATVKLRDEKTGEEDLFRLVGEASNQFDDDVVEVTTNSPLGEALMKSRVGESIRVDLRRGSKRYEIVEIL